MNRIKYQLLLGFLNVSADISILTGELKFKKYIHKKKNKGVMKNAIWADILG